ncbi:MAG: trehalase family glycosidase [Bacteroidota bacterium]
MTDQQKQTLLDQAKNILRKNNRGGFTVPTDRLYPFQWNWDSGFVSFGLAHFDLPAAMSELRTLFTGQWENGMVPHILFHSEKETTYFPNYQIWNAAVNAGAPQKPVTSGITQPPVHGFALERIYNLYRENKEVENFVREMFPKIVRFHRFFYEYRDPRKEGLVFIYHPWESGRDNSPLWDEAMANIKINKNELPPYERQDNKIADPSERPTDADYDRYVYLLELGKKNKYDGPGIAANSPFLIQDTLFNAILIKSNNALINLGIQFDFDVSELEDWQAMSVGRFNEKLWNEELGIYVSYDLRAEKQIALNEIGGIAALFAECVPFEQAEKINNYLTNLIKKDFFLCPTFDPADPKFDSKRYWRGPIWPHMNWLIYQGCIKYGFDQTAAQLKKDILGLVTQFGFYEYYEPQKKISQQLKKGYGGNDFSWAASSIIDLLMKNEK